MKIYSIKEIVKATNNFLKPEAENLYKKNKKTEKINLPPETENIIVEAEKSILKKKNYQNKEKPLLLNEEAPNIISNKTNSINFKIKIKPEIKDHMINELYLYLKKKVRKNTLRLIIDEQLEIKNLKNKVNFLKQTENKLSYNYQILENNYQSVLKENKNLEINKIQLNSEINELKIDNGILQKNLNQTTENKEQLDHEVKKLKDYNIVLQNNLNEATANKERQDNEINELKNNLDETKIILNESNMKNRSFEINNAELKSTVSRYIVNTKKIQEKLDISEQSKNLKLDEQTEKVKFYQEENIRLSSELLSAQKKNETIKDNLNSIETEKEKISNKIKELNKSIDVKTNIIPSTFVKENTVKDKKKIESLNDQEQKSLDEVISRIFSKI